MEDGLNTGPLPRGLHEPEMPERWLSARTSCPPDRGGSGPPSAWSLTQTGRGRVRQRAPRFCTWTHEPWILIPTLPPSCCVTLGTLLHTSRQNLPICKMGTVPLASPRDTTRIEGGHIQAQVILMFCHSCEENDCPTVRVSLGLRACPGHGTSSANFEDSPCPSRLLRWSAPSWPRLPSTSSSPVRQPGMVGSGNLGLNPDSATSSCDSVGHIPPATLSPRL